MKSIFNRRAALIAQCPPLPPALDEADAAKLPIHVTRWGTDGPRVLIIHGGVQGGIGGGPSTFAKQEPLAQQGWRLELVARPGFGESPSRGVDDMEADSRWISDMLGDGAHLIGHSWGGAEALLAAARRPEAIRSLTLIEPALHPLMSLHPRIALNPAVLIDSIKFFGMIWTARSPGDYALKFAHGLGSQTSESRTINKAAEALENNPEVAERVGCSLLQARMAKPEAMQLAAEVVAKAGLPIMAITGGWSPTFDAVGQIAAKLAHGRHVIVRSPNHFVQLAAPEEFNRTIDAFMRDADRAREKP